jgi:hypothetical protein
MFVIPSGSPVVAPKTMTSLLWKLIRNPGMFSKHNNWEFEFGNLKLLRLDHDDHVISVLQMGYTA